MEKTLKFSPSLTDRMSEDVRDLLGALVAASSEFTSMEKSGSNTHRGNKYAKLADIYAVIRSKLHENGIKIVPLCDTTIDGKEELTVRFVHIPTGQWMQDSSWLTSESPGWQGKGSAVTYATRYALLRMCSISPDDEIDDDGAAESKYLENKNLNPGQINELADLIDSRRDTKTIVERIYALAEVSKLADLKKDNFVIVKNMILRAEAKSAALKPKE